MRANGQRGHMRAVVLACTLQRCRCSRSRQDRRCTQGAHMLAMPASMPLLPLLCAAPGGKTETKSIFRQFDQGDYPVRVQVRGSHAHMIQLARDGREWCGLAGIVARKLDTVCQEECCVPPPHPPPPSTPLVISLLHHPCSSCMAVVWPHCSLPGSLLKPASQIPTCPSTTHLANYRHLRSVRHSRCSS